MTIPKGDVSWFLPGAKRPFYRTTVATSDLLRALADYNCTVAETRRHVIFDEDAKWVLSGYITSGYGDESFKLILENKVAPRRRKAVSRT